jgi:hypothetical protein
MCDARRRSLYPARRACRADRWRRLPAPAANPGQRAHPAACAGDLWPSPSTVALTLHCCPHPPLLPSPSTVALTLQCSPHPPLLFSLFVPPRVTLVLVFVCGLDCRNASGSARKWSGRLPFCVRGSAHRLSAALCPACVFPATEPGCRLAAVRLPAPRSPHLGPRPELVPTVVRTAGACVSICPCCEPLRAAPPRRAPVPPSPRADAKDAGALEAFRDIRNAMEDVIRHADAGAASAVHASLVEQPEDDGQLSVRVRRRGGASMRGAVWGGQFICLCYCVRIIARLLPCPLPPPPLPRRPPTPVSSSTPELARTSQHCAHASPPRPCPLLCVAMR